MDGAHSPPPPPPPPPHGKKPKGSGLPDGNYDIFIIPPHSAGSGFLYLPSLRPQTNSFVAGVLCTLVCVFAWNSLTPTIKTWWHTVSNSGGGVGVAALVLAVGVAGWAFGNQNPLNGANGIPGGTNKTGAGAQHRQPPPGGFASDSPPHNTGYDRAPPPHSGSGQNPPPGGYGSYQNANGGYGRQHSGSYSQQQRRSPPPWEEPDPFERYGKQKARTQPPQSEPDDPERPQPRPRAYSNASASWQKAREETKRREDERRQAEAEKKKQEDEKKAKGDAERAARAAAEKHKWEQMRAREREQREREARERIARERVAREKEKLEKEKEKVEKERKEKEEKEKAEREARLKAARDRIDKAKSEKSAPVFGVGERTDPYASSQTQSEAAKKQYEKPTARSYVGTSTAESFRPYDVPRVPKHQPSQASFFSSEYSFAQSHSTVPTSPPPSQRGPYSTSDPDKVMIKGVYQFTDSFPKPVSTLICGEGGVTDGLVLRITTEGMFVDDDVRSTPLRQWDIKAWTLKGIETLTKGKLHIVRASIRDSEGKKYVFVVPIDEEWKVIQGLENLRKGPLVRSCAQTPLSLNEANKILGLLGYA